MGSPKAEIVQLGEKATHSLKGNSKYTLISYMNLPQFPPIFFSTLCSLFPVLGHPFKGHLMDESTGHVLRALGVFMGSAGPFHGSLWFGNVL